MTSRSEEKFWNRKRLAIIILAPIIAIGVNIVAGKAATDWTKTHKIGIDPQKPSCLPWNAYLYTKSVPETFHRGDIVTFIANNMEPHFKNGTKVAKFIAGLPGDKVTVHNDRVYINGQFWDKLWAMDYLKKAPGSYDREFTIAPDEVLVMATNAGSFDGRYWGALKVSRITGYATPLL